jgi:hypothetical protein
MSFYRRMREEDDDDPLAGMINLFDMSLVFAVALMVALVSYMKMPEFLGNENMTVIKNAGKPEMEIIVKEGRTITKYKASEGQGSGKGRRIGVAYELENGEIIYVPE